MPHLSLQEARRLHEEAPSLTVKELRRLNRHYFGSEWLASATKKIIVRAFRKSLERHIQAVTKEST